MMKATPNATHQAITMLQQELPDININVVTQNVDLLHEKAGSKNIYNSSQFDQEILGKASQTFPKFSEELINELKKTT